MKLMIKLVSFFLMMASLTTYADKILLTGRPVILIPNSDYYTFPKNYTPFHKYHFVDISGDKRVCFLSYQSALKPLDLLRITIIEDEKKFLWFCYRFDPMYFTINF